MKKAVSFLLALLLAVSLVGCGQAPAEPSGSDVLLNGVSMEEFTIIYDSDDLYARFAAENMAVYLKQAMDVDLAVAEDTQPEATYEILVGNTNRSISLENEAALQPEEYALGAVGNKIVLKAKGYMIGGAARGFLDICEGAEEKDNERTLTVGEKVVVKTYAYKPAKNALLYIGDGMGFHHIAWAKQNGMERFYAEDMPNQGEAITYSHSVTLGEAEFTDSAAAGTALATGYKTLNENLGVDQAGNPVRNIRELAAEKGGKTAVITTDTITGATPAAFLVHLSSRDMTSQIGKDIRALLAENQVSYALGSVGDQLLAKSSETLGELSAGGPGFFMMLEEGQIDKHSHSNKKEDMIETVKRFNETIANAMMFTLVRGDTVLIVTADHETGGIDPTDNGYQFTSDDHTNRNVPLFAMGKGTEVLTENPLNNVFVPRFLAEIYGEQSFGDPSLTQ